LWLYIILLKYVGQRVSSFNHFFEAEPFAAMMIAHGILGCNQDFVLADACEVRRGQNSRLKAESGEGVLLPLPTS